jgi:hypothetical protein
MALGLDHRRLAAGAFTWMVSGVIATIIASGIAWLMLAGHRDEKKPCEERQCFSQLDRRLAAIEAEMKVRTADRYTGTDAKRDLLIINQRIDALHQHRQEGGQ